MTALTHTHEQVAQFIAHAETDADDALVDFGVGWGARTTVETLTEAEA